MQNSLITSLATSGLVLDLHRDTSNTVILASMGRSGSTLLANIINCENRYRVLFEPFSHEYVPLAHDFVYPLFLKPDDQQEKYLSPACDILSGRIKTPWVDNENRTIFPRFRLIKDIRINLFLRWLHVQFSGLKIVLLLRHPCAVVQSWLDCGFGDGTVARERLLSFDNLLAGFISKEILNEYTRAETAFERLVFFWCIYNKIPLMQFKANELCAVFYENLFLDQVAELSLLFEYIGQKPSEEKILSTLAKPSSTTRKSSKDFASGDNVDGWRKKVSDQQTLRAYEIMEICGLAGLYEYEASRPNRNKLREIMGAR